MATRPSPDPGPLERGWRSCGVCPEPGKCPRRVLTRAGRPCRDDHSPTDIRPLGSGFCDGTRRRRCPPGASPAPASPSSPSSQARPRGAQPAADDVLSSSRCTRWLAGAGRRGGRGRPTEPTAPILRRICRLVGADGQGQHLGRPRPLLRRRGRGDAPILVGQCPPQGCCQARGRGAKRVELEEDFALTEDRPDELLALDEALTELGAHDEPAAKLVKLPSFRGPGPPGGSGIARHHPGPPTGSGASRGPGFTNGCKPQLSGPPTVAPVLDLSPSRPRRGSPTPPLGLK